MSRLYDNDDLWLPDEDVEDDIDPDMFELESINEVNLQKSFYNYV